MAKLTKSGKIVAIGNLRTGVSAAGKEWQTRGLLIDSQYGDDSFENKTLFEFWGDKTALLNGYKAGQYVDVTFDVTSRLRTTAEGKQFYSTTARAWAIQPHVSQSQAQPTAQQAAPQQPQAQAPADLFGGGGADDLPF